MEHLRLGDIDLYALLDAHTSVRGNSAFYPAQPSEWSPGFEVGADGSIPNVVRTLLIRERDTLTLVDTGFGDEEINHPRGCSLDRLSDMGVSPEDISRVIFTHAHGDHCWGNTVLQAGQRVPVFCKAMHVVQSVEVADMSASATELWTTRFAPLAERGLLALTDGRQQLSESIELLPTPGHTIGHQAVVIRSGGETAAYVGDLAVFAESFLRPGWGPEWAWSRTEDDHSRAAVADWAIANDAILIIPHDPDHPFVRLERTGDRLSFVDVESSETS